MKFTKDTTKVKAFSGGFIKETGFYPCTITKCYEQKSAKTLSEAIHFEVVTDTGAIGRFDLWVVGREGTSVDKNGKELSAIGDVNDLMVLLELDDMASKPGKVKVYDFDIKQDVEQRKMVFHDVIDRQIGIVFDMRPNTYNGKTTMRPEFAGFYDADTEQSASEFLNKEEPVQMQRNIDYLLGISKAKAQPNSPQNSSPVDPINMEFDEDSMPF